MSLKIDKNFNKTYIEEEDESAPLGENDVISISIDSEDKAVVFNI